MIINLRKREITYVECALINKGTRIVPRYKLLNCGHRPNIRKYYLNMGDEENPTTEFYIENYSKAVRLRFLAIKNLLNIDLSKIFGNYPTTKIAFVLIDNKIALVESYEKFDYYPIEEFYSSGFDEFDKYLIRG